MQKQQCDLPDHCGQHFDITHSFKVGPSTYHILGLRKDRPSYRNNYYIFECIGHEHEQPLKSRTTVETLKRSLPRSHTKPDQRSNHSAHDFRPSQTSASHRARTRSPKTSNIDVTTMKDLINETMKNERRFMVDSLRKEMNTKKKTIVRTIKKGNKTLLDATNEANKSDEILRLLGEQKTLLTEVCDRCIQTTTSSINTLKETLMETLTSQHSALQSMEQIQSTLLQTIEQEVQKIILKNEQIIALTSTQTNSINRVETTLTQKIDNSTQRDSTEFNRLLTEQKKVLADLTQQQQRSPSLDLIRETMINVLHEQQNTSTMMKSDENPSPPLMNIRTNDPLPTQNRSVRLSDSHISPTRRLGNSSTITKSSSDYHLLKFSIRSAEKANLYAKLVVDGIEYSRPLHTLCQRDPFQKDVYNCYIAPPTKDGLYQLTIFAKTDNETNYRASISVRLPGSSQFQSVIFPLMHQSFYDHHCILIEPLRRVLRLNEQIFIHLIVPNAHKVKIRNGQDTLELEGNELKNDIVKKKIRVRGEVCIIGCWDRKTDATICVFSVAGAS